MFYKFFFKHFVKTKKIETFNNFLFIGPHPDDIELGCGALISKITSTYPDKKVTFLICTDGRYGNRYFDYPEEEIVKTRILEGNYAASILGVKNIKRLPYSDGGFYSLDEMKKSIANIISETNPDIVFVVDPDVKSECHPDHLNVGKAVKTIFAQASNEKIMNRYGAHKADVEAIAFYFTNRPNQKIICDKSIYNKKLEALYAHKSQFPEESKSSRIIIKYLKLKRFVFRADESFRVLDRIHAHCFPEADE